MSHSSPNHPPSSYSDTFEVSFVSNSDDRDEPTGGLNRPGKTVGKFLDFGGGLIDRYLSRAAEKLGYGSRVTAEKIRRRSRLIEHSLEHYRGCDPRWCWECWSKEEPLCSPILIRSEVEKLRKDVRRMLRYVNSNVPLTRKQAADHILELSLDYDRVRTLFNQLNAVCVIEDSIRIYATFRYDDFDDVLLSSSRKALVSLRETKLTSLLKEWNYRPKEGIDRFFPCSYLGRNESLWQEIALFLCDQEVAFLIYRVLSSNSTSWYLSGILVEKVMRDIATCMPNATDFFERDKFESIFYFIFIQFGSYPWRDHCKSIPMDYVLRFARRTQRVLETRPFKNLTTSIENLSHDEFYSVHILRAALRHAITGEQSQNVPEHLRKLYKALDCPVEEAVSNCMWVGAWPAPYYPTFVTEVANYIDSPDDSLCAKAWKYARYCFDKNLWLCDCMLEALQGTNFAARMDLNSFKKQKRSLHVPNKDTNREWETIYRHVDAKHTQICNQDAPCSNSTSKTEQLQYATLWISYIRVFRGTAFSAAGSYPLVAGCNISGRRSYVAHIRFRYINCPGCDVSTKEVLAAVTEDTKPEELRVEFSCPHQKRLLVAKEIQVLSLKYPPDGYPDGFYNNSGGVDAIGPFSWKPVRKCVVRGRPYSVRVIIAAEADERKLVPEDSDTSSVDGYCAETDDDLNPSICSEGGDNELSSEAEEISSSDREGDDLAGKPTDLAPTESSERSRIGVEQISEVLGLGDGFEVPVNVHVLEEQSTLCGEDGDVPQVQSSCSSGNVLDAESLAIHRTSTETVDTEDEDEFDSKAHFNGALARRVEQKSDEHHTRSRKAKHNIYGDAGGAFDTEAGTLKLAHAVDAVYISASDWRLATVILLSVIFGVLLTHMYDGVRIL